MSTTDPDLARLLDAAMQTSRGMRAVSEGKPADFATHSDARSFVGIAGLLIRLVDEVEKHQATARTRGEALVRIAELKIRGGAQLVEAGRWQKVAGELREIAGETLCAKAPAGVPVTGAPVTGAPITGAPITGDVATGADGAGSGRDRRA